MVSFTKPLGWLPDVCHSPVIASQSLTLISDHRARWPTVYPNLDGPRVFALLHFMIPSTFRTVHRQWASAVNLVHMIGFTGANASHEYKVEVVQFQQCVWSLRQTAMYHRQTRVPRWQSHPRIHRCYQYY